MRFATAADNAGLHMTAMRYRQVAAFARSSGTLEIPALRVGDEKVAKRLHAGDRFELFGIDEIGIERDGIGLGEQLHQPAVLLDQIIRQHRDTEPALAGAQYAENIV